MANTTNLNMVKPAGTDHALISVINSNMDIIDGAVGALPSGSTLQGEIDSANTAIETLNTKIKTIENGVDNVSSSGSTIQFTGTHSSVPNVVATGADASGNPRFPVITGRTSTGFSVKVLDASGSSVGGYINWLAIW